MDSNPVPALLVTCLHAISIIPAPVRLLITALVPQQADKASCSASSSLKNVKPQMDANGGRHAVSQQDLRHQRRIITPQALQQVLGLASPRFPQCKPHAKAGTNAASAGQALEAVI